MSLIEILIDTVYAPSVELWARMWHGLQTNVDGEIAVDGSNIPNVFCPIVQCGLKPDFDGQVSNVDDPELAAQLGIDLEAHKLILADCRKGKSGKVHPLHVPKRGYGIHQNREVFDCMVQSAGTVLGGNGFDIVSVGTLGGYSQFFMSLAIKGQESFEVGTLANGAKDTWRQFYNANTSHNGLIASTRNLSSIRQVCWNTVNASIGEASDNGTLTVTKHTKHSKLTPKQFEADLKLWLQSSDKLKKFLAETKNQSMSADTFKAFAAGVFTTEKSDAISSTSFNRVNEMLPLFQRGQGNNGTTVYDGLNAFTEYFTSGNGVGSSEVKLAKRIASANFGRGNEWKLEAMRVAANEDSFQSATARGVRLYNDKAQEMQSGESILNALLTKPMVLAETGTAQSTDGAAILANLLAK